MAAARCVTSKLEGSGYPAAILRLLCRLCGNDIFKKSLSVLVRIHKLVDIAVASLFAAHPML